MKAVVIDDRGSRQERNEARKLDMDRFWWDVPAVDIERHDWILSFLDPIGFHYYLPAYMTWTLKHYEHSDSNSVNSTIYALDYLNNGDGLRGFAMERYTRMNQEQSRAICAFLRFMAECTLGMADEVVAHRAMEMYWGRYCGVGYWGRYL